MVLKCCLLLLKCTCKGFGEVSLVTTLILFGVRSFAFGLATVCLKHIMRFGMEVSTVLNHIRKHFHSLYVANPENLSLVQYS